MSYRHATGRANLRADWPAPGSSATPHPGARGLAIACFPCLFEVLNFPGWPKHGALDRTTDTAVAVVSLAGLTGPAAPGGAALGHPEFARQRLDVGRGLLEAARDGQQRGRGPVAGVGHAADDARLPAGPPRGHRAEGPAVAA